jgi:hypothetical protein
VGVGVAKEGDTSVVVEDGTKIAAKDARGTGVLLPRSNQATPLFVWEDEGGKVRRGGVKSIEGNKLIFSFHRFQRTEFLGGEVGGED